MTFFKNRKNSFDPLIVADQEIETDFEPSKIIVYKIDYDCDESNPYLEFQISLAKALGRHLTWNEHYLMSAIDDGGYGSDDSEPDIITSTRKLKETPKRQEKRKDVKNTKGKKDKRRRFNRKKERVCAEIKVKSKVLTHRNIGIEKSIALTLSACLFI
jgi:hypothetical protein